MMLAIADVTRNFIALCEQVPLHAIENEADYNRAVDVLNELLDAGGADEEHPLAGLVKLLGDVIAEYEVVHFPEPKLAGREMLAFLMEQHGLRQSDLPEVGSQGVVSEILNGKRELTVKHIKALSERFGVDAGVFF